MRTVKCTIDPNVYFGIPAPNKNCREPYVIEGVVVDVRENFNGGDDTFLFLCVPDNDEILPINIARCLKVETID